MDNNNAQKLQALLYAHGGEMKHQEVAALLNINRDEVSAYASQLRALLDGHGLELLETPTTLSLRTKEAYSDFLSQLQNNEAQKDIGAAGLEILAIVLYKNGASRATIDYIRGVNSSATLRQLTLRGLLERARDENDSRAWLYTVTPELLAHMGVASPRELPEYETLSATLEERIEPQLKETTPANDNHE